MQLFPGLEVGLDHVWRLSDGVGVLQHARQSTPDPAHGYCTDDNARALVAVLRACDLLIDQSEECEAAGQRYLNFLGHAFNPQVGRFRNFMSYELRWLERVGSEDSHGRAIWALGEAASRDGHWRSAGDLLRRALPALERIDHPRSLAYALLGLHAYSSRHASDARIRIAYRDAARRLTDMFRGASRAWPWLEHKLTYANARIAQAILQAGSDFEDPAMVRTALRALDWLLEIQMSQRGHFSPIGSDGWYTHHGRRARFSQQPIESASTADACIAAMETTHDVGWLERAETCLRWFAGDNDVGIPMIDQETMGCYDGLCHTGANTNQGAESTLVWVIAAINLADARKNVWTSTTRYAGGDNPTELGSSKAPKR